MVDQRRDSERRPSPEALLEHARREEGRVGKLKIFVGATPGVGKTYEMLQAARAKANSGTDIVVGIVETHGRKETEALLEGLEVIPRKHVAYGSGTLEELDLDALIARRPQIALVDELAHTNAPGSRHPKRYLDVEASQSWDRRLLDHKYPAHREFSVTSSRRSRTFASARRSLTPSSTVRTLSNLSISPPTISFSD